MRAPKLHVLKSWPEHFGPVLSGEKNFEIRINDRDYQIGDTIELREFVPAERPDTRQQGFFTGRGSPIQVISYITELRPTKFVVLGIRVASTRDPVVAQADHGVFNLSDARPADAGLVEAGGGPIRGGRDLSPSEVLAALRQQPPPSSLDASGTIYYTGGGGGDAGEPPSSLDAGVPTDDPDVLPIHPGEPRVDPRQPGATLTGCEQYKASGRTLSLHERELLTILIEEACEVGQAACKLLRFGVGEIGPGHQLPNHVELGLECGDLRHMVHRLAMAGTVRWADIQQGDSRKGRRLAVFLQSEAAGAARS